MASILVVIALAVATAGTATAGGVSVEADDLPVLFGFSVRPSKLPRTEPRPVRVVVAGKYETGDGSHVPALDELDLELDRHLTVDVTAVPICNGGGRDIRREVVEGCEDAVVGKGTIEAEVAFPEQSMTTVSSSLTIYSRGRKPGGADLVGYAFLFAPTPAAVVIPIKVRRNTGPYGLRAHLEIPKLAGGAGSVTAYSMRLGKRIFSATCVQGHMRARAISTFVDGTTLVERAVRTCTEVEADGRK